MELVIEMDEEGQGIGDVLVHLDGDDHMGRSGEGDVEPIANEIVNIVLGIRCLRVVPEKTMSFWRDKLEVSLRGKEVVDIEIKIRAPLFDIHGKGPKSAPPVGDQGPAGQTSHKTAQDGFFPRGVDACPCEGVGTEEIFVILLKTPIVDIGKRGRGVDMIGGEKGQVGMAQEISFEGLRSL